MHSRFEPAIAQNSGRKRMPTYIVVLLIALPAYSQAPRNSYSFFVEAKAGLSSYLGDNNTVVFNRRAFDVENKIPYSAGGEIGYQFAPAWSLALGIQFADYPLITRFYDDLEIRNHPTKRRTHQLMLRYQPGRRVLSPYVHFGYHLTFGKVSIFDSLVLDADQEPYSRKHYIHGPVLGAGLEYTLNPGLSFFVESTSHVALMDDSVDGRLPLGPPQPSNHHETNRFGTFDLLSAVGVGVIVRPWCGERCRSEKTGKIRSERTGGTSMVRYSNSIQGSVKAASYHYSFPSRPSLFFGIEAGLGPRRIAVKYRFTDGQVSLDQIPFTGAFIGASAKWFLLTGTSKKVQPHVGAGAFTPFQIHSIAGVDFLFGPGLSVGIEGRYAFCPTRRQEFDMELDYQGVTEQINYQMTRACEYSGGFAVTMGYRSR